MRLDNDGVFLLAGAKALTAFSALSAFAYKIEVSSLEEIPRTFSFAALARISFAFALTAFTRTALHYQNKETIRN